MPAAQKKILFVYDYFYPAFKAGGPVQSLINLAVALQEDVLIYVLSGSRDLNEKVNLDVVAFNQWVDVNLPGSKSSIKVWYRNGNAYPISSVIKSLSPDTIYLNGVYSFPYVITPVLKRGHAKVIICPRGMLQKGALAGKPWKKKLFFFLLKAAGIMKCVEWHATNQEEFEDVKKMFGESTTVTIAPNIPKAPTPQVQTISKVNKPLRLVYLSLIAEKKNLLQSILAITHSKLNVQLDVYGPVKDVPYWEKCRAAISQSMHKVHYKGEVEPANVQHVFSQYHAGIFLTRGENFGHALYECLSAGRPLIISYFTPWNSLESKSAGWNVDISDSEDIECALDALAKMDEVRYQRTCEGALSLAKQAYNSALDLQSYRNLFSIGK